MHANDVLPTAATRHGAYLCLRMAAGGRRAAAAAEVPALADRLGLRNEFEPGNGDPPSAIAYLRRVDAAPAAVSDDALLHAHAVVHVAAATAEPVTTFRSEFARLVSPAIDVRVLGGVVRPLNYTGTAMFNFSYAHRVLQQPGSVMPNAFLIPMNKTAGWWEKDWMERHTYFLPRYDASGHMLSQGHALAAAAGIGCLMRRTYKCAEEPAPAGEFDFVTYFECADEDVPTFHQVCASLRNAAQNPEWSYVREGPTWHGRRVATWAELFA